MSTTVADVIAAIESQFPPSLAQDWDAVGLVAGDPSWPVTRVHFAIDPCEATVKEAIDAGATMLVTHHPLFLRGTSTVGAHTAKGRWVTDLIRNGVALYCAHTNADAGHSGTAAATAELLNLRDPRPLDPSADDPSLGIGRIGTIEPTTLREFAQRVKNVLPDVPAGILVSGDLDKTIETVAVSPGSGDSYLAQANAADVYVTADLRHHPATDHLWSGGCALICATHFASEWPLLPQLEKLVAGKVQAETYVSTLPTDAWVQRL